MFKFENIAKNFRSDFWAKPVDVLQDVSFEVKKGSLCGFLGANGSGKTTSIKILFRFIKPDRGRVVFDDGLGRDWDSIRRLTGHFPERPYFYPYLSARQFVHYIGRLEGMAADRLKTGLKELGEKFGIERSLDKKVKDFSKGMLQRLGLIVSIIHKPKLLILDEPLSGLDPNGRVEFKNALKDLHDRGTTIFFSSHIVSDIQEICDSLVVIENGKTVFNGKTGDLIRQNCEDRFEVRFRDGQKILGELHRQMRFQVGDEIVLQVEKAGLNRLVGKIANTQGVELLSVKPAEKTLEEVVFSRRRAQWAG